ncbi:hypothetical protein GCM10011444_12700 [Winogradskyella haliclonae]|uniref:Signal transduction histidine kinase internal region domain-containing protein n=2 Tax=Winogradskyella haliclonae TaxID=2048558 RepID=A0ABQ2BWY5_9FLAO|nr:hypothetical protein GCM10011444_12700 [Winogradskyella haliclonae]
MFFLFVEKSVEIESINGEEITKVIYNKKSTKSTLLSILFKIIFYYINVYLLSKIFDAKRHFKYILSLVGVILLFLIIDYFRVLYLYGVDKFVSYSILTNIWQYLFFGSLSFVHIIVLRWQKEEALKQKLKEDKLAAELQLLKSQINPHFLFNALNNLLSISEKHEQTEVSSGISQLSELLRFLIRDTSDNTILLEKEVAFIKNYIELNRLRFDEKDIIEIKFQTSDNYNDIEVAPSLLIPFVENAFKHGIDIYNPSFVHISLDIFDNQVINFKCSNSISKTKQNDLNSKRSGIGLQNVKQRLAILYPDTHDLNINKEDDRFFVELKLYLNA